MLITLLCAALPMVVQQVGEIYRQRREHAEARRNAASEARIRGLEDRLAALEARTSGCAPPAPG